MILAIEEPKKYMETTRSLSANFKHLCAKAEKVELR